MVKLTIDLIARGTSGYTKKKRDESMQQYLKRLTHLYLEDRCIDEVVINNYIYFSYLIQKKTHSISLFLILCDFFYILFYLLIVYYSLGRRFVDVQELDSFVLV